MGTEDFELNDEEIDREQMQGVFVSEEEQKLIQKILEIARKGVLHYSYRKLTRRMPFKFQ